MNKYYFALAIGSFLGAIGQVMLKLGATGTVGIFALANARIFLGLSAYALGTLLWVFALTRIPLNIAYAFTALTFCLVYVFSGVVLSETISYRGWIGLLLIVAGFIVIASGAPQSA